MLLFKVGLKFQVFSMSRPSTLKKNIINTLLKTPSQYTINNVFFRIPDNEQFTVRELTSERGHKFALFRVYSKIYSFPYYAT